jgi:hypothetical protein
MKRLIAPGLIVVLIAGFSAWYRWDSETNRGHTWGYWAQFNTVSNCLAKLPGFTIVKSRCNPDISLEEFGFEIKIADGHIIPVWFSEDDPIRKMSGPKLIRALQDKIQSVTAAPRLNSPPI